MGGIPRKANAALPGFSNCLNCDIARARKRQEGSARWLLFGTPEDHRDHRGHQLSITGQKLKSGTCAPYDPYAFGSEPSVHRTACSDATALQSPSARLMSS